MGHDYPATPKGASKQFGMVDASIIRDPSLPPNVKLVYTYLTTFCGKERSAFPSRARIARELGVSVRTVDTANRLAQEAGLFTIARKAPDAHLPASEEHHQPNVYLVHDFDGSYVVGSGPQGKICASPPVQNLRHPGATVAPYQDHTSGPVEAQTSTPPGEDDCASSGQKQVSDPKLFKPKNLGRMTTGTLSQKLTGTYIAAVRHVDADVDAQGPGAIGRWVHKAAEAGWNHDKIWREFCRLVDRAWAGVEYPWLVASRPTDTGEWAA